MKFSRYNVLVKHEGQNLLFNGLSGALITITSDLVELIRKNEEVPLKIKDEEPIFFDALIQTRALIDQNVDELAEIRERNRRAVFEDKHFELTINPTMDCNFKCWYCYESHVPGRMSLETRNNTLRMVERLILDEKITGLHLGWFGGEPLMGFDEIIYPLTKSLSNLIKQHQIAFSSHITTNAFLLDSKRVKRIEEIGLNSFQITLDGNRERHNSVRFLKKSQRGTFDRVVSNINLLLTEVQNININLRINFEDVTLRNINDIIDIFPEVNRHRLKVDFQRVWQTSQIETSDDLLREVMHKFRKNGYEVCSGSNDFSLYTGKKCYADKLYQALVNWDGNVFKCTARDFTPKNADGHLSSDGQVIWKEKRKSARFKRAPFERTRCLDCSLLPICMGPCTQHAMEAGEERENDYCWLDHAELNVEDFVINRYRVLSGNDQPIAV